MDLDTFTDANAPAEGDERFQLEHSKLLTVELGDPILAKVGSMVAYTGEMTFSGKLSAEGGLTGLVKDAVTEEGTPVMEAEGSGQLYLADQGKRVQVLRLDEGESISVNGNDVLAFDSTVEYEIGSIGSLSGAQAAGLTNVYLRGPGYAAITTHGDPLVLSPPVYTDPSATVAWSGDLSPSISTNKMIEIGQTAGEKYQMEFTGDAGFVVVQPYEE